MVTSNSTGMIDYPRNWWVQSIVTSSNSDKIGDSTSLQDRDTVTKEDEITCDLLTRTIMNNLEWSWRYFKLLKDPKPYI